VELIQDPGVGQLGQPTPAGRRRAAAEFLGGQEPPGGGSAGHEHDYTPASRLPAGERDPGFRTKPQLAIELVQAAQQAGIRFRAVVADCFYGDHPGFTDALTAAKAHSCWR
jgi:hypothetical protein